MLGSAGSTKCTEVENADMVCVTDTRLGGIQELWALAEVERTISRITGKTWGHRSISKKGGCVAGGAMVLYSDSWSGVTIRELVSNGCMIEVSGKWNGLPSKVISVFRPCQGNGPNSMRVKLNVELNGDFEKVFWKRLGDAAKIGPVMIGGDFNLGVKAMDKEIDKGIGSWGKRCLLMGESKGTFRRWDTINTEEQSSEIDHVIWCGGGDAGVKLIEDMGVSHSTSWLG